MQVCIGRQRGECPYGNQIHSVCINPECKQPGILCERGFLGQECGQFHEGCELVSWGKVLGLVHNNPRVNCPEFLCQVKMIQSCIRNVLEKVNEEHTKLKMWVKTYGYTKETMRFIKKISDQDYSDFEGQKVQPMITEMLNARKITQLPDINENDIILLEDDILRKLAQLTELYLKNNNPVTSSRKDRHNASAIIIPPLTPPPKVQAPLRIDSRIISEIAKIQYLFDSKITQAKLLFRASEHKFDIKEFHKACDDHTPTLTLLQTQFGKVIGGYTEVAWSSSKKHWAPDKDLKSFVFSLSNREKYKLYLSQFAIANNPEKGPIFGCCDICIVDKANKERCNAQFPISYNNGKYVKGPDSCFAFTGHPKGKFLAKEWEVFQLTLA